MTPAWMSLLENFVYLPSKLNVQSLIGSSTMTNEDKEELIPHFVERLKESKEDPDKIVMMGDDRGHIIQRLSEENL